MESELRIGVIGAGGRGGLAGLAHRPDEGSRLVAAADLDEGVLERIREKYGAETFTTRDYRALLARADVEAVFVCVPDFLHESVGCEALEAGKTVFVEKPLAITIEGCDRLLATAKRTGSRLYVGHNMRHFEFVRLMKRWIDEGKIGEPKAAWCRHFVAYGGEAYFRDWHADRTKTTGLLLQKGAHDIDVMHWLLGGFTELVTGMGALSVYGQISDRHEASERGSAQFGDTWPPLSLTQLNPIVDVEDLSMVLMRLDNGRFASYEQCHYAPDAWRNYTVIGTEGRIENFGDSPGDCTVRLWNRRHGYAATGDLEEQIEGEKGWHGGGDRGMVDEFLRFARSGGRTDTSPVAARMAVAAGVLATDSIRGGSEAKSVPALEAGLREYFERGQA